MVLRSSRSSREMRRRDQPCAANCCIAFCSCTLRTFAIASAVMPLEEHSAEIYRRLKVGNLESVKRDHFRPEVVPFQRPLTLRGAISYGPFVVEGTCFVGRPIVRAYKLANDLNCAGVALDVTARE